MLVPVIDLVVLKYLLDTKKSLKNTDIWKKQVFLIFRHSNLLYSQIKFWKVAIAESTTYQWLHLHQSFYFMSTPITARSEYMPPALWRILHSLRFKKNLIVEWFYTKWVQMKDHKKYEFYFLLELKRYMCYET